MFWNVPLRYTLTILYPEILTSWTYRNIDQLELLVPINSWQGINSWNALAMTTNKATKQERVEHIVEADALKASLDYQVRLA